jgi:hypothetical protein
MAKPTNKKSSRSRTPSSATDRHESSAPGHAGQRPELRLPDPVTRTLWIYGVDPSAGTYSNNLMRIDVPWEPLLPGPVGTKLAVVDYDPVQKCYYPPVDLEDPRLLVRDGLDPSESDPRFHQQMVYAVASRTIEMFEVALGRNIHWRRADRFGDSGQEQGSNVPDERWMKRGDIHKLKLYPHGVQQANAYYSPEAQGIVFGYFKANTTGQGSNLPGQRVFTCLSYDIIAHEVTHAIIDGIRGYFTEPSNPDVLAFHEGFADLCALFSHFTHKESLVDVIRRTGGRLYEAELGPTVAGDRSQHGILAEQRRTNPLIQLALQFGEARGQKRGLRSALNTPPDPKVLQETVHDPHLRGSILVAAVFDAFFSVYMEHASSLFRIYRLGGATDTDDIPGVLADNLASHACDTARFFFRLCARALDFCPPVDVTFGDFLRALITVACDLEPNGSANVRAALMQSFRRRGIYPEGADFFSEDAVAWRRVVEGTVPPVGGMLVQHPETGKQQELGLVFGSPNGLTAVEKDINGRVLRAYAHRYRTELGLDPELPVTVPSFHPVFRTLDNGRLQVEMVVEVIQTRTARFDHDVAEAGTFPLRGGVTMVIEAPVIEAPMRADGTLGREIARWPEVRLLIGKPIHGDEGLRREHSQRHFMMASGVAADESEHRFHANFGLLHEDR